jgi:hypothetical protein
VRQVEPLGQAGVLQRMVPAAHAVGAVGVAYGRGPMVQLVQRFGDLLSSVELPLLSRAGLPIDALIY